MAQQLRLDLGARRPPVLFVPDLLAKAEVFHALFASGLPIQGLVTKRRDSRYLPRAGRRLAQDQASGLA